MYYSQPSCGEEALEVVDQAARGYCDIIVVDSVAALVPRAEIEGEMGAHQGRLFEIVCAFDYIYWTHA